MILVREAIDFNNNEKILVGKDSRFSSYGGAPAIFDTFANPRLALLQYQHPIIIYFDSDGDLTTGFLKDREFYSDLPTKREIKLFLKVFFAKQKEENNEKETNEKAES